MRSVRRTAVSSVDLDLFISLAHPLVGGAGCRRCARGAADRATPPGRTGGTQWSTHASDGLSPAWFAGSRGGRCESRAHQPWPTRNWASPAVP